MRAFIVALALLVPLFAFGQTRIDELKAGYDREMDALIDRYYHEGNYPKVTELLRVYAKQHPDDDVISNNLAWMYFNIGKEPESMLESLRFVRDNPKNENGRIQLAQQYFTRKLFARVPRVLEPIMAATKHPYAFVMLGRAYEELGMLKSALRIHEARVKMFPDDESGKKNLEKVKQMIAAGGKA
jgi:tetratricopeptide (TPR) repeat protein